MIRLVIDIEDSNRIWDPARWIGKQQAMLTASSSLCLLCCGKTKACLILSGDERTLCVYHGGPPCRVIRAYEVVHWQDRLRGFIRRIFS